MYQTGAQAAAGGAPPGPPGYGKRLLDYAVDNPVKTMSVTVLTYGGLLLLVYFARISFLPDVNLDALASVLYAVALVGLLLAGYTAGTLVLPGLFLGVARDGNPAVKDSHVVAVAAAVAVAWSLLVASILYGWNGWLLIAAAGLLVLCVVWKWERTRQAEQRREGLAMAFWTSAALSWVLWAGPVCAALVLMPLTFLSILGLNGDLQFSDDRSVLFALSAAALSIAGAAALLGKTESHRRLPLALVLAPFLLFSTSLLTKSFSSISVISVNKLGLGEQHFVRAVVSGKTCKVVNQTLGQNVCDPQAEDDAPTAICPVVLRSRIGSQVLLEFASLAAQSNKGGDGIRLVWKTPGKDEPSFARVVLPKEQLLTWSSLSQQAAQAASSPASDVLASWLPVKSGGAVQPAALTKALATVCVVSKVPEPGTSASGPVTAASAPTLIQVDAKGSASHQTVVNVQLQNAVSQNASARTAAGARSGADAKVLIGRPPTQTPKCPAAAGSASCCQPVCCGVPVRDADHPTPACTASAPD